MQEPRRSRDFPLEITAHEARHGFEMLALFRIVDGQTWDAWHQLVGKLLSSSDAIIKLKFKGQTRYQLFRHGYFWFDKKREHWTEIGGESCSDFSQIQFEVAIEALGEHTESFTATPAQIMRPHC